MRCILIEGRAKDGMSGGLGSVKAGVGSVVVLGLSKVPGNNNSTQKVRWMFGRRRAASFAILPDRPEACLWPNRGPDASLTKLKAHSLLCMEPPTGRGPLR